MKIIFLNCWFGELEKPLLSFVSLNKKTTDIFAFLESDGDIDKKFKNILKNFSLVKSVKKHNENDWFDISIFVKKDIEIVKYLPNCIKNTNAGDCVMLETKSFGLIVVHGTSIPGNKLDTLVRLKQTQQILKIASKCIKPIIIGGDFNLMPKTKSITDFSKLGLRNLIDDFSIKATRNKIAWEYFKNKPGFVKQYFADYCFVSEDVNIKNFEVPNIEISDHLPLILEFEV